MQTWRRALMEVPEADRLETALFWLEEMTGGHEQDVAAIQRDYDATPQVAQIIAALSAAAPKIRTKLQLYRVLYPTSDDVEIKIVDVLVSRARRCLPEGAILTVWGKGYQMRAQLAVKQIGSIRGVRA